MILVIEGVCGRRVQFAGIFEHLEETVSLRIESVIFKLMFEEDGQEIVGDVDPVSSIEDKDDIIHLGKVVLGGVAEGGGFCD